MNLLLDLEILGWLLVGIGVAQGVPVVAAVWFGDPLLPFLQSAATALGFGIPLALSTRQPDRRMRSRDAFVVVTGGWLLASIFGALPYVTSDALDPASAFFEAASGFTTTGSTALRDVEAISSSLHVWRSLTQWLGGMGIIVFAIAILPLLGIGGMQLFKAEVPGPITDKLTPRVADTARRLWLVYVGLTALAMLCLYVAGMSAFDAWCHAMTTLATGGFSTRNASIGAWPPAVHWVVTVFMLFAGMNFVLHYQVVSGRVREVLRDTELRAYAVLVVGFTSLVLFAVRELHDPVTLREVLFHVTSLLTTTGFGTSDYEQWPALARLLVLPLLLLGGMAGSTAGGLKTLRVVIGARTLRAALARIIHPHAVSPVRYNGRAVSDEVVGGVGVFFLAYGLVVLVAAVAAGAAGHDIETSLTAALTAVGNVGPGLGDVGPTDNFASFPGLVKITLGIAMIAGRLEIFTVIVLFSPAFWRR